MSYEKLINKLKGSDKNSEEKEKSSNDRKLGFLEFKEPSTIRFRILPHKKDPEDVPFERVFIHLGFEHPNFGKKVPLLCKGKDCPLCSFYKKREKGGDKAAWKYKSNQRYIYYVQYEDDKRNLKLALLSLTYYAHEELKNKMITKLKEGINIFDMNAGHWVEMSMKKINEKRKYIISIDSDEDPVTDMEILDWYKTIKPLHQLYREYTSEELKNILKGEKIEFKSNSNSVTQKGKPETKTKDMKFDSDQVDSIDEDNVPAVSEETPSNMKRLEDIMNRTDEYDSE